MKRRSGLRLMAALSAAVLAMPLLVVAADAPTKPDPGVAPGASSEVTVITNGIYKVSVYNDSASSPGIYTVGTGPSHKLPDADMLYGGEEEGPGTSYLSVYDYSGDAVYTSYSGFSSEEPSGGYSIAYLGGCGVSFSSTATRATTRWTPCSELQVEQTLEV